MNNMPKEGDNSHLDPGEASLKKPKSASYLLPAFIPEAHPGSGVFRFVNNFRVFSDCVPCSHPLPSTLVIPAPMTSDAHQFFRSGRFVVADLVPNPASEIGTSNVEDANAAFVAHLRFNDERNRLFFGNDWLKGVPVLGAPQS